MIKSVLDMDIKNKRVLVRVDFNVPMKDNVITSTIRVDEAMQTISYLLQNGAKVILCSHLGRPEGKKVRKYSLKPVYEYLKTLLPDTNVFFASDCISEKTKEKAKNLKAGEVLLLENLRYYAQEELNDKDFAKNLASLAQIYVNDAFGTAHRKHASTYGVAEFLPSCYGLLIKKELDSFAKIDNPERPFVAILGGAKIKDKLLVTQNLLSKVDTLLIGGGMAYTFLKAQGKNIGTSILSEENLDFCKDVLLKAKENGVKVVLPVDVICAEDMNATNTIKTYNVNKIPANMGGFDIGKKTAKLFAKHIKNAKTVVWNGPLGVYEMEEFSLGTKFVVQALAKNTKCFSIIGGGDVVSAVEKFNLSSKISHVSTGGGASLKLIEGSTLAGIDALKIKDEQPVKKSNKKPSKKVASKKVSTKKDEAVKAKKETTKPKSTKPVVENKKVEQKKVETKKTAPKTTKASIKKVEAKTTKKSASVKAENKPATKKTVVTTKAKLENKPAVKKAASKPAAKAKVSETKKVEVKAPATKTVKTASNKTTKETAIKTVKKVANNNTKDAATKTTKTSTKAPVKTTAKKTTKTAPKKTANKTTKNTKK